jgi:hypothetical protein
MAAAFAGRHPEHCHSFWSVVAMPTTLRDEDHVTRAQATVVAPCGSSTVDSVSPARTWSSSSALWSSQGGRPEKLVIPHMQPWNRMCRSRLAVLRSHWQVSAYHSLHGLRAQIVDHPVWFLLCRRRHLLIDKIAVAGEKLRSSRPKNFACPRVKFRRPARRERPQARRDHESRIGP